MVLTKRSMAQRKIATNPLSCRTYVIARGLAAISCLVSAHLATLKALLQQEGRDLCIEVPPPRHRCAPRVAPRGLTRPWPFSKCTPPEPARLHDYPPYLCSKSGAMYTYPGPKPFLVRVGRQTSLRGRAVMRTVSCTDGKARSVRPGCGHGFAGISASHRRNWQAPEQSTGPSGAGV